jgi:hypothetical protein
MVVCVPVPSCLHALSPELTVKGTLLRIRRTGRALQVGYDGLEIVGLAHLYSAL